MNFCNISFLNIFFLFKTMKKTKLFCFSLAFIDTYLLLIVNKTVR